jgi:enoyl-[acyl-carrier protein] reductase I
MNGKRGLIMGVANNHSIAWGIAQQLADAGRGTGVHLSGRGVRQAGEAAGGFGRLETAADATSKTSPPWTRCSRHSRSEWGAIDFVVHAIGFSDRTELKGRYADVTTRENFSRTMVISAYSFTEVAQRAAPLMRDGGSILTLTYGGSVRVMPNYNVMGVAKAALEAMVRYLAADYGQDGIRVNAISAGPVRTLAGAGIGDARAMFNYQKKNAPLRRTVDIGDVGKSALYLLSDLSSGVTGEIHYVDSGFNITSMPIVSELKRTDTEPS